MILNLYKLVSLCHVFLRKSAVITRLVQQLYKYNARAEKNRILSQNHVNESQKFGDFVLWSNETNWNILGLVSSVYVWRMKNETYPEKCNLSKVKHCDGLVMIYGCFALLQYVIENMDWYKYLEIGENMAEGENMASIETC